MADTLPVIETWGLVRRFGEVTAVNGLTLEVRRGEVFGFLGHNGAGKTTTVRLLNGVLSASDGKVRVLGLDPALEGPALRRRTGVLTENPSLDERLSARENLEIYAALYDVPVAETRRRVADLMGQFDLGERAGDKAGSYSKGMKQRLALARALLHAPELIFLDEPTAGLDPVAARDVRELIMHLSREEGRTVFLCTHNLVEAQRLCDRVAVLDSGRLIAIGTPAELGQKVGQRRTVEVEASRETVQQALSLLRAMPGLAEVQTGDHGSVISFSGVPHEGIPRVVAALVEAGVRLYRVTPQEPSLEDIYFALYEEANGGRQPAGGGTR
ncbi:MAG: ABC transporter ATP-binding protein [Anaerolineae bacterium]|nr:ABC transporter ATP-binding protein [Anaerolineae bacterium]